MTNTPTRQELEAQLAERAWTDDAFRAELTADPGAVIRRELAAYGIVVPESISVSLHEESPSHLHLVLPANPAEDTELDDEHLDLVAGGTATDPKPFKPECNT